MEVGKELEFPEIEKEQNSFEAWEKEQPEYALYSAFPSLHKPRTDENERLKKLSKYSAIQDALSMLGQTYTATRGADVRKYDPSTTHGFLNRYRQQVEEDDAREHESKLKELQQKIRNMGAYRGEINAEKSHQRQVGRETLARQHQAEQAEQQRIWKEEEAERQRDFQSRSAQDQRTWQGKENAANRAMQAEIAKLRKPDPKPTPPSALDRDQHRRQNWMQLQSREGKAITDMTEDQAVALYAFVIGQMRDTGQISDELYRTTYSVERVDPVQIKRIINEHWDKFPETKSFVDEIRQSRGQTQQPKEAVKGIDPLGLFEDNNPLGLEF
jgi:hypothetical protein